MSTIKHKTDLMHTSTMAPPFTSLDDMQLWTFEHLLKFGVRVAPRGLETLELAPVQLVLVNPRRRIVTSAARKWSLPLALGEFCWHLSASNDSAFLGYYSNRWHDFADDNGRISGSCYGYRIFAHGGDGNQWEQAITLLRHDPGTRRAVIVLSHPLTSGDVTAKDVACASSLQFLMRDGRLDAILHMRSNDAFWGFPYDVFFFTMLQELAATELGVELGIYYHAVTSLHLYLRHIQAAERILSEQTSYDLEMPLLASTPRDLLCFLAAENAMRLRRTDAGELVQSLPRYWRELAEVLQWYGSRKQGATSGEAADQMSLASPYRAFLAHIGYEPVSSNK